MKMAHKAMYSTSDCVWMSRVLKALNPKPQTLNPQPKRFRVYIGLEGKTKTT